MTQGLLSIVCGGRVVLKAVCGCDGGNVRELAKEIREKGIAPSVAQVRRLAEKHGFGCDECRVILTGFRGEVQIHTKIKEWYDPDDLYRSTFAKPKFNPRWKRGDGAITAVVRLGTKR